MEDPEYDHTDKICNMLLAPKEDQIDRLNEIVTTINSRGTKPTSEELGEIGELLKAFLGVAHMCVIMKASYAPIQEIFSKFGVKIIQQGTTLKTVKDGPAATVLYDKE